MLGMLHVGSPFTAAARHRRCMTHAATAAYRYAKEMDHHDEIVLRLLKGHCVYSQHWQSDLW
jgi:hypothetical protein